MKKLIPAVLILTAVLGVAAYAVVSLRIKQKYERVRADLAPHVLSAAPMDDAAKALLAEARAKWMELRKESESSCSEVWKMLGKESSVASVVELFTYRMPAYSLLSPRRNRQAAQFGALQGILLPWSVDGRIHVSEDGHTAMIRLSPTAVMVFTDGPAGLCEGTYVNAPAGTPGSESRPGGVSEK